MRRLFAVFLFLLCTLASAQTWVATTDSTEGGIYVPSKAIDDDPDSFYHSQFTPSSPNHPHRLDVDIDQVACVCGFDYRQRHDGYVEGNVSRWEFWTCADGGSCSANGVDWTLRASGDWDFEPGNILRTERLTACVEGVRHVRLRSLGSYQAVNPVGDGRNFAAADFMPRGRNLVTPTPCRVLSLTTTAVASAPYALNLHPNCGSDIGGTVELGDSADYATATKAAQPKGSWVSGKAAGTINLGAFACDTPLWLFVTSAGGSRSEGFPVTACTAKGQVGVKRILGGG